MRLHESSSSSPSPSGVSPSREHNADATKANLLGAAKRRFTVYGFERTTVREIATDAGVNVSLINRYFGSKDGLFAAVLAATAHEEFGDRPSAGSAQPETVVNDLLDGLRPDAWPEFGFQNPLLLLLRDDIEDPATRDLRRRTVGAVVERFAADIEQSSGRSDEARVRAAVMFALMTGVMSLYSSTSLNVFGDDEPALLRRVLIEVFGAIVDP